MDVIEYKPLICNYWILTNYFNWNLVLRMKKCDVLTKFCQKERKSRKIKELKDIGEPTETVLG